LDTFTILTPIYSGSSQHGSSVRVIEKCLEGLRLRWLRFWWCDPTIFIVLYSLRHFLCWLQSDTGQITKIWPLQSVAGQHQKWGREFCFKFRNLLGERGLAGEERLECQASEPLTAAAAAVQISTRMGVTQFCIAKSHNICKTHDAPEQIVRGLNDVK